MRTSSLLSVILIGVAASASPRLSAAESAGNAPGAGGIGQAQDAIANAAGVMDGAAKRPGLAVDLAVDAGLSREADADAAAKAAAQAKAGTAQEQKAAAGRAIVDPAKVPSPPTANTPAGPFAGAKRALRGVYKWMLRNPVEVSFMVAIPVTLVAGYRAGMIAGSLVYYALYLKSKKPF